VIGIRELGWRCNNDGVDIVSSQDVVVEGCFIRSADDAIAVKGLVPAVNTRNVLVRDTLMFPHGNCMEVGFELFNDFVENVTFERNTCLHQMMSAMSVHNGGHAHVRGLTYRNIVIEGLVAPPKQVPHDLSYGYKLLDLQIIQSHYSGPDMDRRGAISNVEYSNIT
jgi:polygalacturonase